jgi:uncharacterized Zn finger protein (UPF0148 family)
VFSAAEVGAAHEDIAFASSNSLLERDANHRKRYSPSATLADHRGVPIMNAPCTKCGTPLETSWSFCPKCGDAASHEAHQPPAPAEHEKSTLPGAFGGLLLGLVTAPMLFIAGMLLCLTGLGAILGIPLIIAAILSPLAGPMFGIGEHRVRCPYCDTREITVADGKLHYCPNCEREFSLSEHHQVAKAV